MSSKDQTLLNLKNRLLAGAVVVFTAIAPVRALAASGTAIDVPAGEMDAGLAALAGQTQQQLLYPADMVRGRTVPALKGRFTPDEALTRLLAGSGVTARRTAPNVVILKTNRASAGASEAPTGSSRPLADDGPHEAIGTAMPPNPGPASARSLPTVEALTVVGSLIRGVTDGPSPVIILSRDQLDRSGHATVAAALAALPQNFAGAVNEALINTGGERQGTNAHFGSGLNLRGLGGDATLVLVNGRRMAGAGSNAEFADISTIPTAAVERVELLLDGASALYGSDAVGGVVNIVLKTRFEGAETRITGGIATSGEPSERQIAQTFGRQWRGGGGLISYEYHRREVLHGSDRRIAGDADLRDLGGSDHRSTFSFPGNILRLDPATGANSPYWAIPVDQPGIGLQPSDFAPGVVNLRNQREGVDVLPKQERHSLYVSAHQALSDRIELSGDLRYGRRTYGLYSGANTGVVAISRSNPYFTSPSGAASHSLQYAFAELPSARAAGLAESLGVSLGGEARLAGDWRLEAYGAYAREVGASENTGLLNTLAVGEALGTTADRADTAFTPSTDGYFNPFAGQAANSPAVLNYIGGGYQRIRNRGVSKSLNAKADGSLFRLPAGAIQLAIGAQHREEGFQRSGTNYTTTVAPVPLAAVDVGRKVNAAFAELRAPIFGPAHRRPGFERLELSLAGRIEHYSDFGWARNPKLGALWSPIDGVLLRASYGRSFRAPALRELSDAATNSSTLLPFGPARVGTLVQSGGNPNLDPETADSITIGFEVQPRRLPGLRLSTSWFDVRFKDRIDRPVQASIQTALNDPNVSSFVRRISPATNPAEHALIAALLADPATRTVLGGPEVYGAIVDSRYVNTASLRVSGLDISGSYERTFGEDIWTVSLSATHLYRYAQQITPTSRPVDFLGVATYPLDLRARAGIDWRRGPLGAGLALNYASDYEDALGQKIKALSTFDLQLRVAPTSATWAKGVAATLNVRNLFNAGPPFYDNTAGVAFDPANADLIGRFVSIQLSKSW